MRIGKTVVCVLLSGGVVAFAEESPSCKDPARQDAPRCWVSLGVEAADGSRRDGERGTSGRADRVLVDNASSMPNARIADLVVVADRSTQDGSPEREPFRRGLIHGRDRVCVTDRYLAWFDMTMQDGVRFDEPYWNESPRAGTLSGFWTLNPATQWFRYLRPSPDGSGGAWAHNELIPGSASPDGGQFWWDQYAPPLEHTFLVPVGSDVPTERHGGWGWLFLSYHYAQAAPSSSWAVVDDGRRSAVGVHYRSTALLASWRGQVDVIDGEDAQDIKNAIRASLEYVCRADDILVLWRFSPERADVTTINMYIGLWLAYAGDNDGTARCDLSTGEQWPNQVFGQPLYVRSSERLGFVDGLQRSRDVRAGSVGKLTVHEPACDRQSDGSEHWDYYNTVAQTNTSHLRAGSWIEAGESPDLSPAAPGIRMTIAEEPSWGVGTERDPFRIPWQGLNVWHENVDSTIGMGTASGATPIVLKAGAWYGTAVSIRSLF